MGCASSTTRATPTPTPPPTAGLASSIVPATQASSTSEQKQSIQQGDTVCHGEREYKVQYISSSKGMLDLRAGDDVLYGVDPALVILAKQPLIAGSIVELDGVQLTVQYVTSRGLLDLKSKDGDVQYGVDSAAVTVVLQVPAVQDGSGSTAPMAAEMAPPPARREYALTAAAIELVGPPLTKVMGSGASLYKCRLDGSAEIRAVKLLPDTAHDNKRDDMLAEIELCRQLHHPHIVRFDLLAECVEVESVRYVTMVMEYVPVTLETLLAARRAEPSRRPFSALRLCQIFGNLASALHYLHTTALFPIVHCDLKLLNLCFHPEALQEDATDSPDSPTAAAMPLLEPRSLSDSRLRLIDFGAATLCTDEPQVEFTGTFVTIPPEMFAQEPFHTPADIWALGMLLQWCLLLDNPMGEKTIPEWEAAISAVPNAALPVFEQQPQQQPQQEPTGGEVERRPSPASALEPLAALSRRCLARSPAERPSAKAVEDSCLEIALAGPG